MLYTKCSSSLVYSLNFKSSLLVKRIFFQSNADFAMEIVDLISRVHLASFFIMLPKLSNILILQLFLIYNKLYWRWFPSDFHYLRFIHINFHSIISFFFNLFISLFRAVIAVYSQYHARDINLLRGQNLRFLSALEKFRKVSSCLSVRPFARLSAWNSLVLTRRIFMKFSV
jgi:hypothetical protein